MLGRLVDGWIYRHPFRGASARRYTLERPAFGDLDARLLAAMPEGTIVDVGAGPGDFARTARAAGRSVVTVEPSPDFPADVRAYGEALPFADGAFDLALCLSSLRHVRDRLQTLRELRRVARRLWIVELDPGASRARIANHRIASWWLRAAFGPLVCRTAPPASVFAALAREAGWHVARRRDDKLQPVYILECDTVAP